MIQEQLRRASILVAEGAGVVLRSAELASELLDTIKSCSPEFFERLVLDLLVKMGYGGTRKDAGQAAGLRAAWRAGSRRRFRGW